MCGGGGSSEVLNFILEYDSNFNFLNKTATDVTYKMIRVSHNFILLVGDYFTTIDAANVTSNKSKNVKEK